MQAIQTSYDGYNFRSRTEARWAVFFNELGVLYEYEREGFDLNGFWYLPDFWLPTQCCWIEIKSVFPQGSEKEKLFKFHQLSTHPLWIVSGAPGYSPFNLDTGFGQGHRLYRFESDNVDSFDGGYDFSVCDNCFEFGLSWSWWGYGDCPRCYTKCQGPQSPRLIQACNIARSARFEHGESPRV